MPSILKLRFARFAAVVFSLVTLVTVGSVGVLASETLPWQQRAEVAGARSDRVERYEPLPSVERPADGYGSGSAYNNGPDYTPSPDYAPQRDQTGRAYDDAPGAGREAYRPEVGPRRTDRDYGRQDYGRQYDAPVQERRGPQNPSEEYYEPYDGPSERANDDREPPVQDGYYTQGEITDAGHRFFGSVSEGLASVIEYAFQKAGRPNGYILGEDAGGAFVAGLRYGEGTLYSRRFQRQKVFWQGPSVGYDFGAAGSKTMVLVYNLRDISQIFQRFGGVEGSAYFVGGVSLQFQKVGDVVLALIRSGVGVRLGANIGYLKYTRRPTWNPF